MYNLQEEEGNKYTLKTICVWFIMMAVVWIANELGILQVTQTVMRYSVLTGFIIVLLAISVSIFKMKDLTNRKYFLCVFFVLLSSLTSILLHFHIIAFLSIPILIASYYNNKRLSLIISAITILSVPLTLIAGYYLGTLEPIFLVYLVYLLSPSSLTLEASTLPADTLVFGSTLLSLVFYVALPNVLGVFLHGYIAIQLHKIREKATKKQLEMEKERNNMEKVINQYLDPTIAKQILTADSDSMEPVSESRQIAVMFADISGYTSLSEQVEPQIMLEVLNRYLSTMSECVSANNGVLDKFIGDCVMAFWLITPEQNGSLLAVRTAADIRRSLDELNNEFSSKLPHSLRVNIGINAGDALVGQVGGKAHTEFTVLGDTVNVASRLQALAKKGAVYVTEEVKTATDDIYSYENRGSVLLKGRTTETTVYSLN